MMWIFTEKGFFSVAQHYTKEGCFQIKSRAPGVLEEYWPDYEIEILDNADYRYRITIEKYEVIPIVVKVLEGVDYSNFKSKCFHMNDYHHALMGVWSEMNNYQTRLESD